MKSELLIKDFIQHDEIDNIEFVKDEIFGDFLVVLELVFFDLFDVRVCKGPKDLRANCELLAEELANDV